MRLPVAVFFAAMTATRAPFGVLPGGAAVEAYTLRNANGIEVRAIAYGATIISVRAPDRTGRVDDVVLGFDTLDDYLTKARYFGAIVGRYGNRIASGRFTLDGSTIQLAANNGPNHLHGGVEGFDKVVWNGEPFERDGGSGVRLHATPARTARRDTRHAERRRHLHADADATSWSSSTRRRPTRRRRST